MEPLSFSPSLPSLHSTPFLFHSCFPSAPPFFQPLGHRGSLSPKSSYGIWVALWAPQSPVSEWILVHFQLKISPRDCDCLSCAYISAFACIVARTDHSAYQYGRVFVRQEVTVWFQAEWRSAGMAYLSIPSHAQHWGLVERGFLWDGCPSCHPKVLKHHREQKALILTSGLCKYLYLI